MHATVWLVGALVGAVVGAGLVAALVATGMGALLVAALVLLAGGTFFGVLARVARWAQEQHLARLQDRASAAALARQEQDAREREGWSR